MKVRFLRALSGSYSVSKRKLSTTCDELTENKDQLAVRSEQLQLEVVYVRNIIRESGSTP